MQREHWLLAAALVFATAAHAQGPDLALTWLGRDAVFVEMASIRKTGDQATFRALRIVDGEDAINGERFLGGWQAASIDCRARTFRALSFASLRESGVVGPEQVLHGEAYPIAGGSAEAGMESAVCRNAPAYGERASSVDEAVRVGRAKLATH
jgi:hypothetical protein